MSSSEDEFGELPLTLEDVLKWHKSSMEDWLSARKMPKSGRTKTVLANRIIRAIANEDSADSDTDDDEPAITIPSFPGNFDIVVCNISVNHCVKSLTQTAISLDMSHLTLNDDCMSMFTSIVDIHCPSGSIH